MTREWTLAELAQIVGSESQGDPDQTVSRAATLDDATPNAISYCSSRAHIQHLKDTKAGIVILDRRFRSEFGGNCIIAEFPRLAFAQIIEVLHPCSERRAGIHPTAVVGDNCRIEDSVFIAPNAVIGSNATIEADVSIEAGTVIEDEVEIGEGSRIGANCVIYRRTEIGRGCRLSAGVVLGAPGFSFEWDGSHWVSVRNIGTLVIGDHVDIGACTSIDRGSTGATRVHNGVRIDNNCQIGHNVEIGEHTLIVAGVGIGGSATLGKRCVIGGHAAIKDNVSIVDDAVVLGTTFVTKSIEKAGTYSSAVPARDAKQWNRSLAKLIRQGDG